MTGQEFIPLAIRTEKRPDAGVIERMTQNARGLHGCIGMVTEAGELADQLKKHVYYNKPLDITNIQEEMADSLWYMAILLDEYGGSFEGLMEAVIQKLKKRYPDAFTEQDALNRNTDNELAAFKDAVNKGIAAERRSEREQFSVSQSEVGELPKDLL